MLLHPVENDVWCWAFSITIAANDRREAEPDGGNLLRPDGLVWSGPVRLGILAAADGEVEEEAKVRGAANVYLCAINMQNTLRNSRPSLFILWTKRWIVSTK